MHGTAGVTVGLEERGHCEGADSNRATQHVQWDYLRSATAMDSQGLEGGVQVFEQ